MHSGRILRVAADFSPVTVKTRRQWNNLFRMPNANNLSRSLYSVKFLMRNKVKQRHFLTCKNCLPLTLTLKRLLKNILQKRGKGS